MNKFYAALLLLLIFCSRSKAQQVDSIFFHLYTDSLKKGTYNYINVDGKTHTGSWVPLTDQQVSFSCSAGRFEGNSLVLDKDFRPDSVVVSAGLKYDITTKKTITIYVKKLDDHEKLKTKAEIMRELNMPSPGEK